MRKTAIAILPLALLACLVFAGQSESTPRDILNRSLAAHGGEKLSQWTSLEIRGTVDMLDGITFRGAFRLLAKSPGKLRVERDFTVTKGGRYFYEDFLNNGVAWSRRNLVPVRGNLDDMNRWWSRCYGIAHYAAKADNLTRKEDSAVEWREKSDLQSTEYRVVASRPAYVITAVIGGNSADLYIDKETFYFLQEVAGRSKRLFWDFKKFGDVTWPTSVLEITSGTRAEQITPFVYESVRYNVAIEDWLFTEDMPPASPVKK